MKELIFSAIFLIGAASYLYADTSTTNFPINVVKHVTAYAQEISTLGLCTMSFGAGLLCKRHPVAACCIIAMGSLIRVNPTNEGHKHIGQGLTQIQNADEFEKVTGGARKVANGILICAQDVITTLQNTLEKQA